ncbi:MAG TPA: DUF1800 domain-containing protein, partial [Anaerolineae bacterium]|nr:DUF1800 domain-containing protein [Anaerolineae bacterium]
PAMLVYLDNATSQAHAPNENYAREVMELHTLGVAGGYNQQDVHEVARALTGWSVAGERDAARVSRDQIGQFLFRPFMHDNDVKTILGMPFPAGGGESDGDKVIELFASHPSTAKFIAKKLCVRFVSDTPPPSILDRAAATYTQTDGDIKAILKTILTSAEFAQSIGQKYKRPFDFIVASLRALNAEVTLDPNVNLKAATKNNPNQALQRNPIFLQLVQLGHVPYLWSTPDGFPDKAVSWLSTSGTLGRWNFALSLVAGMRGVTIDDSSFTGISKSIEESVDRLSTLLIGTPMPANPRSILIDYAQHAADQTRLPGLAALIISSPQFQIR